MPRHLRIPTLLLTVLILVAFGGCPDSTDPASNGGVDGVISYVPVEGGCWTIVVDSKQRYQPLNLPASFQRDGLAVRVQFEQRTDMASFCMVGPIVQIVSIQAR